MNYVEDSTLSVWNLVLSKLEKDFFVRFTSFQNKYFKSNTRKSHLLTRSDSVLPINNGGINSIVAAMKN